VVQTRDKRVCGFCKKKKGWRVARQRKNKKRKNALSLKGEKKVTTLNTSWEKKTGN